jgi:hypothetical protein
VGYFFPCVVYLWCLFVWPRCLLIFFLVRTWRVSGGVGLFIYIDGGEI